MYYIDEGTYENFCKKTDVENVLNKIYNLGFNASSGCFFYLERGVKKKYDLIIAVSKKDGQEEVIVEGDCWAITETGTIYDCLDIFEN